MVTRRVIALFLAAGLIAAACSTGAASPPPSGTPIQWRSSALVDVRTGASFTIDDLAGRLVVIEPMAIWCTTCQIQQAEVAEALDRLDRPDITYISIDIDPNERAADLAEYADRSGYDWSFAVATADVARSLATTFGDQVLSPPSTPLILIAPSGEVVDHHFGIRNAGQLVEQFSAHLP